MNMATAIVAQAAPSAINLVRLMKTPLQLLGFPSGLVKSIRVIVQRERRFWKLPKILEPSLSPALRLAELLLDRRYDALGQ
jgi:hypothetical protein